MNNREKILDVISHTPCVAVSSKTAAEHILDNLISHGVLFNEWISVKDRLPEHNGYFLVYMPQETKGFDDIMQFYYCGNNEWDDGRGIASSDYYGITHWQPLPEPPEVIE